MAGQKFTLTFDANLEVSKMKGSLGEIQKSLNGLQLPQNVTKGLQGTFQKLSEEIRNFEVQAGKDITGKADFSKLEKSADKVNSLFEKLRIQLKDLGNLSNKDLEKLLPDSVAKNINDANKALKTYEGTLKSIQGTIDDANNKIADQQSKIKSYQAAIQQLIANKSSKVYDSLKQTIQDSDGTTRFETEAEALQRLKDAYDSVKKTQQEYQAKVGQNPTAGQKSYITKLTNQLKQLDKAYQDLKQEGNDNLKLDDQIKTLETSSKSAQTQITKLQANLQTLLQGKQGQEAEALQTLLKSLQQIQGIDLSKFSQDAQGAGNAVQQYINENLQKLIGNLQTTESEVSRQGPVFNNFRQQVQQAGAELVNFDNRMREVEQLKSRILYFFSLNNSIQLVRRTMRDAYNTIKELDKAMTETAVVTDFSVGDMWAQLPEYTKRANELGVTTKAAYEAATLYYQQGLKTNEVMAISNETLKMARIAGLDAATATDRMTNAVRGFNMEINEANTQRVNDVYSRLAAISASNVDEISTAMTKVASLAHNANMEFETTAAFLAQIIETTRESAETAGTALKTVVARFSEVKKLVDEGELEGTDEEGEVIDVNKVSKALRTAGIDMNRYFLGEVGIDDIFMELASKWDSLTTLQQRYIATQAAGSRQQSRFIALMSDYARTQELVGEAYKATGASAKQFAKTQESLESKLARLKNAWDEFAMGIANSDLVKLGVDALTGLLNIINGLTSGFGLLDTGTGKFINTFAKLALLISGLKVGKGLAAGLFGSMLGAVTGGKIGGGFTQLAASAMGVAPGKNLLTTLGAGAISPFSFLGGLPSKITAFKNNSIDPRQLKIQQAWANSPAGRIGMATGQTAPIIYGSPKTLFGALGNRFATTGVGNFARGTLAKLGMGGTAGAAGVSGVAALAATIGTVTVAAGLAAVAIKKMYDASPAGQIKLAQKYADSISIMAENAKQQANELQSVQEQYNELEKAYNNATTQSERNEAIKARSDYIKSLLEQDATYAKYIKEYESQDHQIYLTLDADKLEEACNKIAEAAIKAQGAKDLADANVDYQQYEYFKGRSEEYKKREEEVLTGQRVGSATDFRAQAILFEDLANQYYENYLAQFKEGIKSFIPKAVNGKEINEATSDFLASLIASANNDDIFEQLVKEKEKELSGDLEDLYEALYGVEVPEELKGRKNKSKLKKAIASVKVQEELDKNNEEFINAFVQMDDERQQILLDLIQNEGLNLKPSQISSDLIQHLQSSYEDIWDYLTKEIQNQILGNAKYLTNKDQSYREVAQKTFLPEDEGSTYYNIVSASEKIKRNQDLSINDINIITDLLSQFATLNATQLGDFVNFLQYLIHGTGKLDKSQLIEFLKSLDLQDADSIRKVFSALGDLDISFDHIGNNAEDAADRLIQLAHATEDFDLEAFQEKLSTSIDLAADIKDRDKTDRTFNAEDFANLLEAGASREDFYYTGITGKEYVYIGQDLQDIISLLQQQLGVLTEQKKAQLEKSVQTAQTITGAKEYYLDEDTGKVKNLADVISTVLLNQEIDEDTFKWLKGSKVLENLINEDIGQGVLDDLTSTGLLSVLDRYMTDIEQFEDNQAYLAQIQQDTAQALNYLNISNERDRNNYPTMASANGNVDPFNRPQVAFNEDNFGSWIDWLTQQGDFDTINAIREGTSIATVWSHGVSDENGTEYAFTPILPNGEVLTPETFWSYIDQIIASEDPLAADEAGLEINGQAISHLLMAILGQDADPNWGENYHNEQAQYYQTNTPSNPEVVSAEFFQNSKAIEVYDTMADAIKKADDATNAFNFTNQETINITKELALEWSKQSDNLAELTKILDDNDDILVSDQRDSLEFANAVHQVGEAMRDAYGSQISDEFVQAHLKQITLARESKEAYQELLSLLQEDFFANAKSSADEFGVILAAVQQQMIDDGLTAASLDGMEINGVAVLDDTPWMQVIEALMRAGYDVKAFFDTLGWTFDISYQSMTGPDGRTLTVPHYVVARNTPTGSGYTPYKGNGYGRGSSAPKSGSGSGSSNNPTVWENDLDWLYNLMEDIAELERQQTKLAEKHDRYLNDQTKTGRDLYNVTKEQLNNLQTTRSNQIEALTRRRQEMSEQIGVSGYGNYVSWNDKDQTIEIDWDAIEAIQDKDTYDEVKDLVSRVEKIQDEMDSAQDALWDIEGQIKELEERYLQEFVNFQQRVLDAVVNQYQKQIDDLSSLNDTLNDTNSRILDSISKEIDLERQIRDNTDTENNIADMEARLAYLRRDTTGANDSAIRDLEKQLSEARENYADTLIDQQLNRLSEANEKAADQREQQIALMTAQLEYWQETGALWQEVSQLMDEGFNSDGSLIGGSKLEEALKNAEDWKAMSEQQREVWGNELITSANQAGAYLLKISEGLDSLSAGVWAMLPSSSVTSQKLQYATGGLNKATGWAWLDGTANEPEYVLNARQTDAFLRLSEILPSMFNNGTVTNNNLGGNVYVELTMNVSDISSDYDVDRFMDRVKTNIYDAASYRNTVGLNFMK